MTSAVPVHLVIMPIVIPLGVGALMLFFEDQERRLKTTLSIVSLLALVVVAAVLFGRVHAGGQGAGYVYLLGNWPIPVAINLVADRLSTIMVLLTAVLALPAVVFAAERWSRVGPHFHSIFQFLLVGINGAFLTGDLFNLFVFFEVMLAASYGLVLHGGGEVRVRAGLHYIAINLLASLIFLIGIAMVFSVVGSLNMAEIAVRSGSVAGFAKPALHAGLAMIGLVFLVKAGMWPLGFWLVPAYSAAAAPVAAILAMLSKVGVYALLRLALLIPSEGVAFGSLIIFIGGVATLIFALIGILSSQSMKRSAAYFVLMSSGTLLAAFGISQPGATAGALFYLLSSTLAVGAFFLVIELLEREQGAASDVLAVTREAYGDGEDGLEEAEEVGQIMPGAVAVLGFAFCLLALVLIGLPPLPGFIAKVAVLTAILGPGSPALGSPVMVGVLATLLILSGLVALVALSRMGIRAFWAPLEPFMPKITFTETAPILFLVALLIGLVVQAGATMDVLRATADDLHDQSRYVGTVLGAERVPPFAGTKP